MQTAKKIVVITPKEEREELRSCGVLPESCFRDIADTSNASDGEHISPVCLWPYDIDYTDTAPLVENIEKIQADVPAFLGLGVAESDEQLRENEHAIESLFGSIILHIVFLDERVAPRGYANLRSFEDISEWGMNFRKAIDSRFPREYNVHFKNHVLVLISRRSQITSTEEELQKFRSCIGKVSGVFSSCYFMDYNLFIERSRKIYHSVDVWSVMVSRLIMAFMLSQNTNGGKQFWEYPGIKVWNAQECMVSIEKNSGMDVLNRSFAETLQLIQDKVAENDDNYYIEMLKTWGTVVSRSKDDLGILKPDYAKDSVNDSNAFYDWLNNDKEQPAWRSIPKGGWSNFNAKDCATNTKDDKHWKESTERIKANFGTFVKKNHSEDFSSFVHKLFDNVKRSSALLFSAPGILLAQIAEAKNSKDTTAAEFKELAKKEQARLKKLEDIKDEAVEMDRARAHYVGYGPGLLITVAIALMMGWVIWRIMQLLGGDVLMPIVLTGAIWGGSLLAMGTILWFHSRRGKIGVAHIIKQSKEADELMLQRDQHARNILMQGIEMRDKLLLNSIRFRVWALLNRTQKILLTELQPQSTEILEALGYAPEEEEARKKHARRDKFIAETRKVIGPFPIIDGDLMQKDIERLAKAWVCGEQEGIMLEGETFRKLWHRLCATDRQSMGYHPAKLFSNELHSFVLRFLEELILVIDQHIIECRSKDIKEEFENWFKAIKYETFAHFATAAIDGTVLNRKKQLPCFIFANEGKYVDGQIMSDMTIGQNIAVQSSKAMERLPILALQYQEYCLDFAVAADGQLTFKEAKDA